MPEMTLAGFAERLERAALEYELLQRELLDQVGDAVAADAKSRIGTYDGNEWPALAESTIADRVRRGYSPDEPLLRTGQLRDSIQHEVDGDTVTVGSGLDIAAYQELGTSRIPPRPFIAPAMMHAGEGAVEAALVEMLGKMFGN
ncbi:HK97 gp10 family phage protein [Endobacter medicaginis]|uniref:HK97 gp10 family phage protein n=1 Tax=Endobacter medicaginis TaxID=1181271 RepID=A0A839V7L1_9PROT|nr:HK97-gp10 family putative phage morphogenesis protein [Endobacter medicaginis]MBB3175411.1 HK97 gp10 family phage protein [Endobacter medicaginis]MCX5476884.1 phage virion morphogenesis protein [Endobacter medicaginis]NVN29575.1 phage virion morphogenesis protein [Endobacter medicaginis]